MSTGIWFDALEMFTDEMNIGKKLGIKDYMYYYAEFLEQGVRDTYVLLLFLMKVKQLKQPSI